MDFDASSPEAEKAAAVYGRRQAVCRLEEKAADLLAAVEAGDLYRAVWLARGVEDAITGEDATTRDAYGYRLEGDLLTGQRLVKDDDGAR